MCKLFIKKAKAKLRASQLLILTLTIAPLSIAPLGIANGAIADIEQRIIIKSKRQASDLKNKIASYLDDVVITQGTLSIHADIVQVVSKAGSKEKTYIASGKPAIFKQLLDDGQPINLQADEIKYEPASHTITISGHASVSQEGSLVSGNIITYNTLTEQLSAESKKGSDEQVTTILQPQSKDKN